MQKLMIVGGGSAGWMSAIYLNRLFNHSEKNCEITVVESPDIGIIGVGEATVHSIRFFFAQMGLDENELIAETNATLKTGIMFRNWKKPVAGKTHEYFHPFEQQQFSPVHDMASAWMLSGREQHERYDEGVSFSTHLAAAGRAPKTFQSPQYQGVVPYGYHIDAHLMAKFLRRKAVEAGVIHIEDTVTDVQIAAGKVMAVLTDKHGALKADSFIDCTGFRGLLINKLKEGNWRSFEDALPCNRAVAIQRAMPEGQVARPYTTATALTNGWVWEIDLVNRQGTGYVYDGNRMSKEEAEAELREFLGPQSEILKCLHLNMNVGSRDETWVGNVIAVGLSSGFIEPLESTGLHLINLGVGLLATHLTSASPPQSVKDSYNRLMRGFYDELKRFIVLHYCLTDRDDTAFWRDAPATAQQCERLPELLDMWRHKICEFQDLAGGFSTVFSDENYRYVLYGMQHYPELGLRLAEAERQQPFDNFQRSAARVVKGTMPHGEWLADVAKKREMA